MTLYQGPTVFQLVYPINVNPTAFSVAPRTLLLPLNISEIYYSCKFKTDKDLNVFEEKRAEIESIFAVNTLLALLVTKKKKKKKRKEKRNKSQR